MCTHLIRQRAAALHHCAAPLHWPIHTRGRSCMYYVEHEGDDGGWVRDARLHHNQYFCILLLLLGSPSRRGRWKIVLSASPSPYGCPAGTAADWLAGWLAGRSSRRLSDPSLLPVFLKTSCSSYGGGGLVFVNRQLMMPFLAPPVVHLLPSP